MNDESYLHMIAMKRIDHPQSLDLNVGDAIQLQDTLGDMLRFYVKLNSIEDGKRLVISHPHKDGVLLPFEDGHAFVVRVLSGRTLYEFNAEVLGSSQEPYPHMNLNFPEQVEYRNIHADLHVKPPSLTCWVERKNASATSSTIKMPMRIIELGTSRITVHAKRTLGEIGNSLDIMLQLPTDVEIRMLIISAVVRKIWQEKPPGEKDMVTAHELEIIHSDEQVRRTLQEYIYKTLAEGQAE